METKHHPAHEDLKMAYQCPMRCEENKVYDHQGNCPVCNMKLVQVKGKGSQGFNQHYY